MSAAQSFTLEDAATALCQAHVLSEAVQAQVEALDARLQGVLQPGVTGLCTALGILVQQLLDTVAVASESASNVGPRAQADLATLHATTDVADQPSAARVELASAALFQIEALLPVAQGCADEGCAPELMLGYLSGIARCNELAMKLLSFGAIEDMDGIRRQLVGRPTRGAAA